jgi:hypothetical protein
VEALQTGASQQGAGILLVIFTGKARRPQFEKEGPSLHFKGHRKKKRETFRRLLSRGRRV